MVDNDRVRKVLPCRKGFIKPFRLGPGHLRGVVGVQQHQAEIVAEIQGVVTGFRKQAIEQGVEKGCLFPGTVTTVHLMVADTRNEGNQPARGINHGAGVVADKSDAGLEGTAVVIAQVPPDNSKHGILAGCDDIIVKAGLVDPAIPTRHKGDCVVGLGWHGPESIGRRAPADFENMVPAWPQSGQLSAEDLEITLRIGASHRLLGAPGQVDWLGTRSGFPPGWIDCSGFI